MGYVFFLVERFNGDRDDHPWVPHVWSHAGHFPVESQDSRHRGSLGTAVPGGGGDETKWNIVKPIKRPTLFFSIFGPFGNIFYYTQRWDVIPKLVVEASRS